MSRSRIDVIGRSGFEGGYWWGPSEPEHRSNAPVRRAVTIMAPRPPQVTYAVRFIAPVGSDGIRGLRAVLKTAWRRYGLRAIDVCESTPQIEKPPTVDDADGRKQNKRAPKGKRAAAKLSSTG